MDTQEVIPIYLKISELTGQMLEAAQNQNWDQLSELEKNCAEQVNLLKEEACQIPLPGKLRTQKIEIIQKILGDDRAIRNLTEPWMRELQSLMQNTGNRRKLEHAYRNSDGY